MTKIYRRMNNRFVTECETDTLVSVLAGLPNGMYETWAGDVVALYVVKRGKVSRYGEG
jgi:hypothetical protein